MAPNSLVQVLAYPDLDAIRPPIPLSCVGLTSSPVQGGPALEVHFPLAGERKLRQAVASFSKPSSQYSLLEAHTSPLEIQSGSCYAVMRAEDQEGKSSVMRPVARRVAPLSHSPASNAKSAGTASFPPVPSSTLSNPDKKRLKSAWARYETPASNNSPTHRGVSPPSADAAILAAQAAAQRMWEHAAAESDATDSPSLAPQSPAGSGQSQGHSPLASHGGPPASMLSLQEAYLSSLRAARRGRHDSEPVAHARQAHPLRAGQSEQDKRSGPLPHTEAERHGLANGSLSILPEAFSRSGAALTDPSPSAPQPGQMAGLAHIAWLSHQLEELLRSQGLMHSQSHLPILASEPPIYGGGPAIPLPLPAASHPAFPRRQSCEDSSRGTYPGNMDSDSFRSESSGLRTDRRWNPAATVKPEGSLYPANSLLQQHVPQQAMSNLSAQDSQTLLHSISLLYQANEMAAVANSRIQAFSMAANANLEGLAGGGLRKRKMSDLYDEAPKRHSSLLSESDSYGFANGSVPQMCAECGVTSTPTWRRSGKKLMCNACGLRRSRSIRSARSNSMPLGGAHSHGSPCGP